MYGPKHEFHPPFAEAASSHLSSSYIYDGFVYVAKFLSVHERQKLGRELRCALEVHHAVYKPCPIDCPLVQFAAGGLPRPSQVRQV